MLSKLSEINDSVLYIVPFKYWIVYAGVLMFLTIHFSVKPDRARYVPSFLSIALVIIALFGFAIIFLEKSTPIEDVLLFLIVYSVALYIVLCDVLLYGVAKWLTQKRGEKWVKELDYFYLTLGAVRVIGSLNKIESITGRYSKYDIIAPLVLATAVVIRFIKTRADIGGWNKPTSPQ
jgi:predicted membrane protein